MRRRNVLYLALVVVVPVVVLTSARYETVHETKEAINKTLKHADGAQYRNIRRTNASTICGEVNEKNSNGDFQGFRYFYISDLTEPKTIWLDNDKSSLAEKVCTDEQS